MLNIAEGLAHLHAHNVLHLDLKPHNVLLSKDGLAKLCDFGLSRLVSAGGQQSFMGCGTVAFMAVIPPPSHSITFLLPELHVSSRGGGGRHKYKKGGGREYFH
jgi:serine/threonine protein kinase